MRLRPVEQNIIKILNGSSTYTIPSEVLQSEYVYPIQEPDILDSMKGEDGCCKAEDYLIEKHPEIAEQFAEYKKILGNGNFNPNKEYKLREYFVPGRSFERLDNIFNFKNRPQLNRCITYVGDKGSGKTATQNCWLHDSKKRLDLENIIWVRCDAYKLYGLWEENTKLLDEAFRISKEDRRVTVSEYIDVQLCYVFCKYSIGKDNKYFERILEQIKEKKIKYGKPISKDWPDKKQTFIFDEIVEINKNINSNEHFYKTVVGYSYAINEVLAKSIKTAQFEKKDGLPYLRHYKHIFLKQDTGYLQ